MSFFGLDYRLRLADSSSSFRKTRLIGWFSGEDSPWCCFEDLDLECLLLRRIYVALSDCWNRLMKFLVRELPPCLLLRYENIAQVGDPHDFWLYLNESPLDVDYYGFECSWLM